MGIKSIRLELGKMKTVVMAWPKEEIIVEDVATTNSLRNDTMLNILQSIPTGALLSVMAFVCHEKFGIQIMELAKRHASTLQSIELRSLKQLTGDKIQDIFTNLPQLQHLTIPSYPLVIITESCASTAKRISNLGPTCDRVHTSVFSLPVSSLYFLLLQMNLYVLLKLVEVAKMYSEETMSSLMPQSLVSLCLYIEEHVLVRRDLIPAKDLMSFKGHQLQQLQNASAAQFFLQLSWDNISKWCVNLKSLDLSCASHHDSELQAHFG